MIPHVLGIKVVTQSLPKSQLQLVKAILFEDLLYDLNESYVISIVTVCSSNAILGDTVV